ncbi:hypothetical protein C8J56DRAFT_769097, partial [Mycena floridula]
DKSRYYGLYNKILNYWFPPEEGFDVNPQWKLPQRRQSIDFVVSFTIMHNSFPLILVENKPGFDFRLDSARERAMEQIIQRLDDLGPLNHHFERLYAIQTFGKKWRAAYAFRGRGSTGGQPVRDIAERPSLRSPNKECWNDNILSDSSYKAMETIVAQIKSSL